MSMNNESTKKAYYNAIKQNKKINCLGESLTGCKGDNIKSHGLQRNGVLSNLTKTRTEKIYTIAKKEGGFKIHEVHSKTASTFPGFCNKHDTEIFKDIETGKYNGTKKEHFLYAFRCNSMSYYQKINSSHHWWAYDNYLKNESGNISSLIPDTKGIDGQAILTVDEITDVQRRLTKKLRKKDWQSIDTKIFNIDCEFNFSASFRGIIGNMNHKSFSHDKESEINEMRNSAKFGNGEITARQLIENVRKLPLANVFITVIPNDNKTTILLSFESKKKNKLRKSFAFLDTLNSTEIKYFFSNLLLEEGLNIYFNQNILNRNDVKLSTLNEVVNYSSPIKNFEVDSYQELEDIIKNQQNIFMKDFDLLKKPKANLFI
jgi:hypothetical protein